MQFKITPEVLQQFPGVEIGLVITRHVDNTHTIPEITSALAAQANTLRQTLTPEALNEHPNIVVWRTTYKTFGAKPKDHRSSIENLLRLVLGGRELRPINPLVDIYNLISLKYVLPLGGEDLSTIRGDVRLTMAGANEPTVLLLGDKEPHAPHAGEVIYTDDVSALCRRWNWREADRTKLTATTTDCILVIEALPPITANVVDQAATELCHLIVTYCGATTQYYRLNQGQPSVGITHE